jgi:hypothetical protein
MPSRTNDRRMASSEAGQKSAGTRIQLSRVAETGLGFCVNTRAKLSPSCASLAPSCGEAVVTEVRYGDYTAI